MAKRRSEYHQIISSIISPTVAALVVILNLLKLYVIKTKQRQNKSVSIIYLINVSISDITVGILIIVYRSMYLYVDNNAVAEEICKIIQLCLIRISLFVSVFNLVALTLNQMWAIRKPFIHRKYGTKFAIKICFAVWMIFHHVCCRPLPSLKVSIKKTPKSIPTLCFPVLPIQQLSYSLYAILLYSLLFANPLRREKKKQEEPLNIL